MAFEGIRDWLCVLGTIALILIFGLNYIGFSEVLIKYLFAFALVYCGAIGMFNGLTFGHDILSIIKLVVLINFGIIFLIGVNIFVRLPFIGKFILKLPIFSGTGLYVALIVVFLISWFNILFTE